MLHDKFQMLDVLCCQAIQLEPAVRQVDTFVRQQFLPAFAGLCDFDPYLAFADTTDYAFNSAIVDQNAFTRLDSQKYLRQGTGDTGCANKCPLASNWAGLPGNGSRVMVRLSPMCSRIDSGAVGNAPTIPLRPTRRGS